MLRLGQGHAGDPHELASRELTGHDADVAASHAQLLGQEPHEFVVGTALDRRSRKAKPQAAVADTRHGRALGAGRDPDGERQPPPALAQRRALTT